MSLELEGRPKPELEARAREVIEQVGLDFDAMRSRFPWQLSGGQRQRVGLARALALDPSVMLMDEPFGALDPLTRSEMQEMFKELQNQKKRTVLLVTHDLGEALYLADRVIILDNGEVVADLPESQIAASNNPHVKDYVSAVHHLIERL
jgi:osmoprotectant transport system ATP-binding protein